LNKDLLYADNGVTEVGRGRSARSWKWPAYTWRRRGIGRGRSGSDLTCIGLPLRSQLLQGRPYGAGPARGPAGQRGKIGRWKFPVKAVKGLQRRGKLLDQLLVTIKLRPAGVGKEELVDRRFELLDCEQRTDIADLVVLVRPDHGRRVCDVDVAHVEIDV